MKGVNAYRLRVGDYRVIYDFDRERNSPPAQRQASARGISEVNQYPAASAVSS
jgi:hypothetical protein